MFVDAVCLVFKTSETLHGPSEGSVQKKTVRSGSHSDPTQTGTNSLRAKGGQSTWAAHDNYIHIVLVASAYY